MRQNHILYAVITITALLFSACGNAPKDKELKKEPQPFKYPKTTKQDVVDNYHGTEVKDPYRWLEDDNSEETKSWVKEQNALTDSFIDAIPYRDAIEKRLTELWDYPKISAPFKRGDYYYQFKNTGLQPQSVLYRMDNLESEGEVLLDPNTFSEDGTVSLAGMSFSDDYKYLCYGTSEGGSDWNEWQVMNLETGELLSDKIEWMKFGSPSWFGEHGFFYTRFPAPLEGEALSGTNRNGKIYYHKLGTKQESDILIFEDPENPTYYNFGGTTENNEYFVLNQSQGTHGENLMILPLTSPEEVKAEPEFTTIVGDFANDHGVVRAEEGKLTVLTNYQAPNYRLVTVDLDSPEKDNWENLVAEDESVLQSASTAGGHLFLTYLQDASSHIYVYDYKGQPQHKVELPTLGTASGFSAKEEDKELFYSFTSFTYPTTVFRYDIDKNESTMFSQSKVKFDPSAYETKEVTYKSKDGESVHMFITHKKGLELDGKRPTMLYGYGGFNISLTPSFSVANVVLLENGGVYAVANIRGGGEYGESWHEAGMLLKKQNVFDDFISGAEYLIEQGYTSSEKLAIRGGSNGGLLVGACMTQRPELFQVALPAVGVLDMLRYHKFTVGAGWAVEYGSSDEKKHFENLIKYSPYHNIEKGEEYPATLVMTADHDDRVVPAHSFKFISRLQEMHAGENPVMIRIDTKAGHGAGKSTQQTIEEYADMWSFLFYNMDETVYQ